MTDSSEPTPDESPTMFGELYEWHNCPIPGNQITSLQVSDDPRFSSDDLTIICAICPLKQLFLHNLANLICLPPKIARLSSLRVFSITHCFSLTELPLAIRFLLNLETLRLDCPNLVNLPAFLCLMPSLCLILLRKSIAICGQCKQHPKKSTRIIIVPQSIDESSEDQLLPSSSSVSGVESLSVLAANSYVSYFTGSVFYLSVPVRSLWPAMEAALDLPINRCVACLSSCPRDRAVSIGFTRLFNCKCIHLRGFLCSDSCLEVLVDYFRSVFVGADIFTTGLPQTAPPQPCIVRPITSLTIRRRIKEILSAWAGCIPRYHKKSYTVNAS